VGSGRVNVAVADAGPLIHLTEIGCLSFLHIFETLHIPDAVWLETVKRKRVSQADVLGLGNVQRHTLPQAEVTRFIRENCLEDLHAGERECLYLCQEIGVYILLTDDLAVREATKHLQLTPVGSLGIVVKAYQLEHISLREAEHYIVALYER
jgi:predicted nucleic acid-binding protein